MQDEDTNSFKKDRIVVKSSICDFLQFLMA